MSTHFFRFSNIIAPNPEKPELNIDPPEAERFVVSLSEA
jgi:hypothetical protein